MVITAGEAIFMLPFLIPRLYRPLMLKSWGMTNTELGVAFSAYGFSSMISYILGGHFADRYHPRVLIAISLVATALGGVTTLFFHNPTGLTINYFFFGISNIFLMWGALIKVTHISGGDDKRSSAMGILDSGRGLIAAIMSSVLDFLISLKFQETDLVNGSKGAMNLIYLTVTIFTILVSAGIWFSLKGFEVGKSNENSTQKKWTKQEALEVLKNKNVWLLGLVILCAYCGYKSVDNYGVFLVDVKKVGIKDSATFTSVIFWLRPISALAFGFLADFVHSKIRAGRFFVLAGLLLGAAITHFLMAVDFFSSLTALFGLLLGAASLSYGLRAIYFSIFGDMKIPDYLIGTVVGVVSFVGFLPDIFYGLTTGYLIDQNPGLAGFQLTFVFTAILMLAGAIAAWLLSRGK